GTTPIFLARDKDLPAAKKELEGFTGLPTAQKEIQSRLQKLLGLAAVAGRRRLEGLHSDLERRLNETVLSKSALRNLAPDLTAAWRRVGIAYQQNDRTSLQDSLEKTCAAWRSFCRRASEMQSELDRRQMTCAQALQWIASGQISGFALTEPSAG